MFVARSHQPVKTRARAAERALRVGDPILEAQSTDARALDKKRAPRFAL